MTRDRVTRGALGARPVRARRLTCALIASLGIAVAIVFSSRAAGASTLGAPSFWPWLLTGLQVAALWGAGRGRWWGWLLGASVQTPWVVYAIVTGQLGFIPGCAVSAAVQVRSFLRNPIADSASIDLAGRSGGPRVDSPLPDSQF